MGKTKQQYILDTQRGWTLSPVGAAEATEEIRRGRIVNLLRRVLDLNIVQLYTLDRILREMEEE